MVIGFRENPHFGGRMIQSVQYPAGSGQVLPAKVTTTLVQDRLGSVVASKTGTNAWQTMSYYPYGEERTSTANDRDKFATYWRDPNGLDYAWNRYYQSGHGRFLSPDPYQESGGAANPQSWNRYPYVLGDPVNLTDGSGLMQDQCVDPVEAAVSPTCIARQRNKTSYMASFVTVGGYDEYERPWVVFQVAWMPNPNSGSAPKKQVNHVVMQPGTDCWSTVPSPQSLAQYRATTFVAQDGAKSYAGVAGIVIKEAITVDKAGKTLVDRAIIPNPDSEGSNGVFNDRKGLAIGQKTKGEGLILYQFFKVSISGGPFMPVKVNIGTGDLDYLPLRMTGGVTSWWDWTYDNDVFVNNDGGKRSLQACPSK